MKYSRTGLVSKVYGNLEVSNILELGKYFFFRRLEGLRSKEHSISPISQK